MKRWTNYALIYGVLAMAGGVFYREFTKFSSFSGKTALAVVHTHYFMLGMVFFLLLLLLDKTIAFSDKKTGKLLALYNMGLNISAAALIWRGVNQVMGTELSAAVDASISGTAGTGHILLGVSMILLLLQIKRAC